MSKVHSKSAVAKHFGVDVRSVTTWCDAGCPHVKKGRRYTFDIQKVTQWRAGALDLTHHPDQQGDNHHDEMAQLRKQKLLAEERRIRIDADRRQLELDKAKSVDWVEIDAVQRFLTDFNTQGRRRLFRIPMKISRRFGEEAGRAVEQELELACKAMAKIQERLGDLREDL